MGEHRSLEGPVLIIWGREDQLIDISRSKKFASELAGEKLIIYENVGHLPMEEVPADVAQDIKLWWEDEGINVGSP